LTVGVSSFRQQQDGSALVTADPWPDGREGGILWEPELFTTIRLQNLLSLNKHDPPHPVGYDLIPELWGTGRTNGPCEEFTHNDFWVTRAIPDGPNRVQRELDYRRLPFYADHREPIEGRAVVLWHQSPIAHWPCILDVPPFANRVPNTGSHTMWGGFHIRPRDFFSQCPLYP
jgi:Cu2+-containing amine oxidase